MKAILVIDIPNYVDFNICKTVDVALSFKAKEYTEPFIKSNVPLKPLPQKLKLRIQREWITDYDRYEIGYNACLDEITRKKEDCRDCQEWESCPCGKIGHDKGTTIGYSIGECKHYKEKHNESSSNI